MPPGSLDFRDQGGHPGRAQLRLQACQCDGGAHHHPQSQEHLQSTPHLAPGRLQSEQRPCPAPASCCGIARATQKRLGSGQPVHAQTSVHHCSDAVERQAQMALSVLALEFECTHRVQTPRSPGACHKQLGGGVLRRSSRRQYWLNIWTDRMLVQRMSQQTKRIMTSGGHMRFPKSEQIRAEKRVSFMFGAERANCVCAQRYWKSKQTECIMHSVCLLLGMSPPHQEGSRTKVEARPCMHQTMERTMSPLQD